MNLTITEADRERLATAIEFYLARCTWSSGDEEKAEFERVLADLNGRSPRNLLVASLRDNGMEARWAEVIADRWIEYAGSPDSEMRDEMRWAFTVYVIECEAISSEQARGLVERLRAALPQEDQEDQV